jgi:hypothetical protein
MTSKSEETLQILVRELLHRLEAAYECRQSEEGQEQLHNLWYASALLYEAGETAGFSELVGICDDMQYVNNHASLCPWKAEGVIPSLRSRVEAFGQTDASDSRKHRDDMNDLDAQRESGRER